MPNPSRNKRLVAAALATSLLATTALAIALARTHADNKRLSLQNTTLNARVAELEKSTRNNTASITQIRSTQNKLAQQHAAQLSQLDTRINAVENATADVLTEVATEIFDLHQTLADNAITPAANNNNSRQAAAAPADYIVQPGDTTATIIAATNTQLADLVAANPDTDWGDLRVGQKLKLPLPTTPGNPPSENNSPAESE